MTADDITGPLAFGFVDLCGFTRLAEQHGDQQAAAEIATFRLTLTNEAARHAISIHRWLGDGAMLVAAEPLKMLTTLQSLDDQIGATPGGLATRSGIAVGTAYRLDGDYIGRAANLASRLCDRAAPHQILADAATFSLLDTTEFDIHRENLRGIATPVDFADLGCSRHAHDRVADPICGMEVDPAVAISHTLDDETAWFCSIECGERWLAGRKIHPEADHVG